jgi:hypothetical protein
VFPFSFFHFFHRGRRGRNEGRSATRCLAFFAGIVIAHFDLTKNTIDFSRNLSIVAWWREWAGLRPARSGGTILACVGGFACQSGALANSFIEVRMPYDADVIVAGGGAGGATLAYACARAGKSVLLLERSLPDGHAINGHDEKAMLIDKSPTMIG